MAIPDALQTLAQRVQAVAGQRPLPAPPTDRKASCPRVVIVGAGFAGLNAAKALADAPVDVVLVDRNNYHEFQPLLYQVATSGLSPDDIAHNVRKIFAGQDNVSFRMATVERVDREAGALVVREGAPIPFDYCILAAGAVSSFFGVEGAQAHSYPLKNLPDAIALRHRVLRQFERYDEGAAGEGALTFVVVGGGPTGVETAGALVELFEVMRGDFHHFDARRAEVYLVEMGDRLLPSYSEEQSAYTRRVLERRGVRVLTGTTVTEVTPEAVHFEDREPIATQTLVWGAGVEAAPLAGALEAEQVRGGRVRVAPDLSLEGLPEVFVVGDMAACEAPGGEAYPQLAPVAVQQGRHAAEQVLRRIAGRETIPFAYVDLGKMATIGRHAAVAALPGGVRLQGYVAWLAWAFIHIAKLVGFRNRAAVVLNWIYNYFTFDRSTRLILDVVPLPENQEGPDRRLDREGRAQVAGSEAGVDR